jgi:hypothetical protein
LHSSQKLSIGGTSKVTSSSLILYILQPYSTGLSEMRLAVSYGSYCASTEWC